MILCRQLAGEEVRDGGDAIRRRGCRYVARRIDALHAHAFVLEGLQQRAVIAAHLDDEAALGNAETFDHGVSVALEVLDQAQRYGCSIGVIAEQNVGVHDVEVLQVATDKAKIAVEGVEVLRLVKALGGDESVADSRGPNRQDMLERSGSA